MSPLWGRTAAWVAALAAVSALLGTIAALIVPPGLPYDEPAHWANVLFYAQHASMPVLGKSGVTYEGQQAPAYYVVAALMINLFRSPVDLLAVRLFGVVGLVLMVLLVAGTLHRVLRSQPIAVVVGTAFIALNPMLIVMSASVQNDTWALVAGFATMLAAMSGPGRHPWWHGIAIGILGALAVLAKVSMAPLVVAVVLVLLWRRRFAEATASLAVVVLGIGWWVARNIVLYGDLTGQAGVDATGVRFGRGPLAPAILVRESLTYLTLPTEYLRNTISGPWWIDLVAVAVAIAMAVGIIVLFIRARTILSPHPTTVVVVAGIASVAAWLAQVAFGWQVAFRTAYGALPLFALAFGTAAIVLGGRASRVLAGILVAILLTLTVWTGMAIVSAAPASMLAP